MNSNKPKCVNCLQNDCVAGEVNHESRLSDCRGFCLLGCGCQDFVAVRDDLYKQSVYIAGATREGR